ncbi:hypothetical protein C8J57DRAFT_1519820 [Mycena rebaudengoi]|nr:hypothetical protein C8J57DRAFT_1519820 [Mycena rebaudengoi]
MKIHEKGRKTRWKEGEWNLGLGRAGASAAIAPSAWYNDGDVLVPAPSSQGHSSYSTSHVHRSSYASSHAHFIQSPPSVTVYTTSSSATHPEPFLRSSIPTSPSSYSHGAPEETGVKDFFGHLRSGHTSSTHAPPTSQAAFALGTPTHPTPRRIARPSSLLNPPVLPDLPIEAPSPPVKDSTFRTTLGGSFTGPAHCLARIGWGGWLKPSLMEDDAPRVREGLLRPGLPSQFPPSASTGTLGDHHDVNYSRPIGASDAAARAGHICHILIFSFLHKNNNSFHPEGC